MPNQKNAIFNRNAIGWNVRANFGFDLASNTAYGPLIGHFDLNSDLGNGFDSPGSGLGGTGTYVNTAYVTWAGLTAGKAQSFFSFIGGGDNWNNFFSPDRKGFNEPNLLAYTASFGGGFTATLSAESQGASNFVGGTNLVGPGNDGHTYGGERWPDIVGALHVKQGWGEAQVSGVIHNVNVRDYGFFNGGGCGILAAPLCGASESKVGWGVDAGLKWNLPSFGAGDDVIITGAYTQNAVWYSGLPDAMNGENGQVNGNGQPMILADAYFNPLTNSWSTPRAWSVSGLLEHHWTPTFYTDLEGSVGGIQWSGQSGGVCCGRSRRMRWHRLHLAPCLHLSGWRGYWLEPGHQPELRPRVDVSAREPGRTQREYRDGLWQRRVRARSFSRRQQRFPGTSPHHPLLLIASRSVETDSPGAKAPGFLQAPLDFGVRILVPPPPLGFCVDWRAGRQIRREKPADWSRVSISLISRAFREKPGLAFLQARLSVPEVWLSSLSRPPVGSAPCLKPGARASAAKSRLRGGRGQSACHICCGRVESPECSTFNLKPTDLTETMTRQLPVGSSLRRKLPICTSTMRLQGCSRHRRYLRRSSPPNLALERVERKTAQAALTNPDVAVRSILSQPPRSSKAPCLLVDDQRL